jgi:hypothetical protein
VPNVITPHADGIRKDAGPLLDARERVADHQPAHRVADCLDAPLAEVVVDEPSEVVSEVTDARIDRVSAATVVAALVPVLAEVDVVAPVMGDRLLAAGVVRVVGDVPVAAPSFPTPVVERGFHAVPPAVAVELARIAEAVDEDDRLALVACGAGGGSMSPEYECGSERCHDQDASA